ncbi:hypothetical protein Q5752_005543 [Cryptotrichosporon argae]
MRLFNRSRSTSSGASASSSVAERERLDTMHVVHTSLLGPYHAHVLASHLETIHASGRRSRVLDVGTGTGAWALALANTYAHADVLGIDLAWSSFARGQSAHGNVDFQTVDVVHVKCMLLDVPHYGRMLERLALILRSGGLLVLVETEPIYKTSMGSLPPALKQWDACVREAYKARHGSLTVTVFCAKLKPVDIDLPRSLHTVLAASGVFASQFLFQELGVPVGGYVVGDSQTLACAGQQHATLVAADFRRLRRTLLEHGYQAHDVDGVIDACMEDVSGFPRSTSLLHTMRPATGLSQLFAAGARFYQRLFAVYAFKQA